MELRSNAAKVKVRHLGLVCRVMHRCFDVLSMSLMSQVQVPRHCRMVLQIEVAQARLLQYLCVWSIVKSWLLNLTLVAQCCKLVHLSFLYAVAVLDLFYRKQSNSPIQQASKGCLDCFVQVEAQFGLLRALQGRRIECRMQIWRHYDCFMCSESYFGVLACFIDDTKKIEFRMLRLTEGLETELSDRLQRYLLGDLFGEGASNFESRDDMCVQQWGGIRTPKEFESNDCVRQFLEDLYAAESFAHPDICAARSDGKAKKRKFKCKCCCRSGGRRG